jgi:two-component system, OmpR family, sensor kinase
MGRLFWKLFCIFSLAMLTASVSVGALVWVYRSIPSDGAESSPSMPITTIMNAASTVLKMSGPDALRVMLEEYGEDYRLSNFYVVNDEGEDILGRKVPAEELGKALLLAKKDNSTLSRYIMFDNDRSFLLFLVDDFTASSGPPPWPPWLEKPPQWLMIAAGLFTSVLFSALLAWYLVSPVRHLRSVFMATERGDFNVRAEPLIGSRRDEIADLGRAYDNMLDKIKGLMFIQKRLFHDVSHELRSPLARLQIATGLAKQNPDKIGLALDRIELESERLNLLVSEILVLARLESDVVDDDKKNTVELTELAENTVADACFEAEAKNCTVEYDAYTKQVFVEGHLEMIARAFENVIRNAIKYTLPGTCVTVKTGFDPVKGYFTMDVSDQGPGVPEDDLSSIFTPFYRSKEQDNYGGFGLGLAIACRAIESQGGTIRAFNEGGTGLSVAITIPASLIELKGENQQTP